MDLSMSDVRLARGLAKIREIHGEAGIEVLKSLEAASPELARFTVEFAFGDVYRGGALTTQQQQIATIAALVVLGHAQPQLRVHIRGALNVGCTRAQVMQVIVQMAVYGGFPAALNAAFTAKSLFDELDRES